MPLLWSGGDRGQELQEMCQVSYDYDKVSDSYL